MRLASVAGLVAGLSAMGCSGTRDEDKKQTSPPPPELRAVVGVGTGGFSGDNGPALAAELALTRHVGGWDAAGNLFLADGGNHRIRRVDAATDVITTVVGTGTAGFNGDGLPGTSSDLNLPMDVAIGPNGRVYIAEHSNDLVRVFDPLTGVLSAFAGDGTNGYGGDGNQAAQAQLSHPQGIFVTAAGVVYIADTDNHVIRRVDVNGVITTVAGVGSSGDFGDGDLATNAALRNPNGVEVDPASGDLYIADTVNDRVRRVDAASGRIHAFAGTGTQGSSGDGGQATLAELNQPHGLCLDGRGRLFIADTVNQVIRMVDTNGIITRVAGTGVTGYNGDGLHPLASDLNFPFSCELGPDGLLYVVDQGNFRIRHLPLPQ